MLSRFVPIVLCLGSVLVGPTAFADEPRRTLIEIENSKPGTESWQLTNPATRREIEGYASLTSVNRGDSIELFVSTEAPLYEIEIFRMGWYGGKGGRRVAGPFLRRGRLQATPAMHPIYGTFDCAWTHPFRLHVRSEESEESEESEKSETERARPWLSGVYLAKLTAIAKDVRLNGKQSYIIFVVREDSRRSAFLYQASVLTWNAYNSWPGIDLVSQDLIGKSIYTFNSSGSKPAVKVSFNRPYAIRANPDFGTPNLEAARGMGAGEFLTTLNHSDFMRARGQEYNMVRFLEREGYDVTYSTDVDTHRASQAVLLRHEGFLAVGHDEYWTGAMLHKLSKARDAGLNIAFFTGNTCYRQVRLEPDRQGNADRIMVSYKDNQTDLHSKGDPVCEEAGTCGRGTPDAAVEFQLIGKREDALLGVRWEGATTFMLYPNFAADYVLHKDCGWVCENVADSTIRGVVGYETDHRPSDGLGPDVQVHATADYVSGGGAFEVDMVSYESKSSSTVFNVSTIQWSWGLDDYDPNVPATATQGGSSYCDLHLASCVPCSFNPTIRCLPPLPNFVSPAAQQITRNVLNRFHRFSGLHRRDD